MVLQALGPPLPSHLSRRWLGASACLVGRWSLEVLVQVPGGGSCCARVAASSFQTSRAPHPSATSVLTVLSRAHTPLAPTPLRPNTALPVGLAPVVLEAEPAPAPIALARLHPMPFSCSSLTSACTPSLYRAAPLRPSATLISSASVAPVAPYFADSTAALAPPCHGHVRCFPCQ